MYHQASKEVFVHAKVANYFHMKGVQEMLPINHCFINLSELPFSESVSWRYLLTLGPATKKPRILPTGFVPLLANGWRNSS